MKTRVERINPYLEVRDIPESIAYYNNVLGFNLYVETPVLGIVEKDGHQIHLRKSEGRVNPHRIWIGVDDVEILFKQYQEKDAIIHQEPTNYSWSYQMMVSDLDGNKLIIGSGPKENEPFEDLK